MTVSDAIATLPTIDEIVLDAYQLAGVIDADGEMTAGQRAVGRRRLDKVLDQLTAHGVQARFVVFYNLALEAGEPFYTLPAQYADVIGSGAYIDPTNADPDQATGETPVSPIPRETWQLLSSKSAPGRPYNYYAHRAGPGYQIEIRLWPVPDEAGTIRFQLQRHPADTLEGHVTLDLQPYWMEYIDHRLAYVLATTNSIDIRRCSTLREEAKRLKDVAVAWANDHNDTHAHVVHDTPWS